YKTFSQNPYQIHPTAVLTSKAINTKEITAKLRSLKISEAISKELDFFDVPEEEEQSKTSLQAQIEQPPPNNMPY
ncbi:18168_t:CDS:1, partial [Cetraspora pellucida]